MKWELSTKVGKDFLKWENGGEDVLSWGGWRGNTISIPVEIV